MSIHDHIKTFALAVLLVLFIVRCVRLMRDWN